MAKLLMSMDKDIKYSLTTSPGYQTDNRASGYLKRGFPVYGLITSLLKHKQNGLYARYDKDFKDMVADLIAQGNGRRGLSDDFRCLACIGT